MTTITHQKIIAKRVRIIKQEIAAHPAYVPDELSQQYLNTPEEELAKEIIEKLNAYYLPVDTLVFAIMKQANLDVYNAELYNKIKDHINELYRILGKQY